MSQPGYKSQVIVKDIHSAIKRGYYSQVRTLLSLGHDSNAADPNRWTPLIQCAHMSSERWAVGIARLLLEAEALIGLQDKHGLNALHHACIKSQHGLVELYLSAVDYDLNSQDKVGNTALHYCVLNDDVTMTQMITNTLTRYKMTLNVKNKEGYTAASIAVRAGKVECAIFLQTTGAKLNITDSRPVSSCSVTTSRSLSTLSKSPKSRPTSRTNKRPLITTAFQKQLSLASRPSTGMTNRSLASTDISQMLFTELPEQKMYNRAKHDKLLAKPVINKKPETSNFKETSPKTFTKESNVSDELPCWKNDVIQLFNEYNFQWTSSYCKSVTPPSTDALDTLNDLERPSSPNLSEASEPPTEAASFTSKRSLNRRTSTLNGKNSAEGNRKNQKLPRSRKTSMYPAGLVAVMGMRKS